MSRTAALWLAGLMSVSIGLAFVASGCAADPYEKLELGPARSVLRSSVEALGGLERWQEAGAITAQAVVTLYDEKGKAMVNKHEQTVDLKAGTLEASASLAEGHWTARVTRKGKAQFTGKGKTLDEADRQRLLAGLALILHRVGGPLNLCGLGEAAGRPERVRPAGMAVDLVRVPAGNSTSDVVAYYFDAQTSELRLVTAGADEPLADGTVTVYTYGILLNGMGFPRRIRVVKIGRHALVGETPVLEVIYSRVQFE